MFTSIKRLPITKAYFQGQFCNICKCPDAHFYYIKIRIAKRKKKSFFWLSDLSSKIVFKFAVSFRYWSLQTTHSYLENKVYDIFLLSIVLWYNFTTILTMKVYSNRKYCNKFSLITTSSKW